MVVISGNVVGWNFFKMGAPICGVHWIPISDKEGFMKDSKKFV